MTMRRIANCFLFATLVLALPTGIAADDPPPLGCQGDANHDPHQTPSGCMKAWNKHFDSVRTNNNAKCDWGSIVDNCNGCYACCNGNWVEKGECVCSKMAWGSGPCASAALHSRNTCRTECVAVFEGEGCTHEEAYIG